jgi:prevent-host-death family protein
LGIRHREQRGEEEKTHPQRPRVGHPGEASERRTEPEDGRVAYEQRDYNEGMKVNLGEAKNKLSKLLKQVEKGRKVTICRRGEPVAELVRTVKEPSRKLELGFLRGKGVVIDPDWWKPLSDEEVDAFLDGTY